MKFLGIHEFKFLQINIPGNFCRDMIIAGKKPINVSEMFSCVLMLASYLEFVTKR
jgi:hypothetical protein